MKAQSPSKKLFVMTWLILVILHFSILGTSMLPARALKTPIILIMMLVQTALVMLFFMEAKYAGKLIRFFTLAGFFWLAIQFLLTGADYLTRMWH